MKEFLERQKEQIKELEEEIENISSDDDYYYTLGILETKEVMISELESMYKEAKREVKESRFSDDKDVILYMTDF